MRADSESTTGRTINSRYHLRRKLGQGGMGTVFEALDLARSEVCAVKLLRLPVNRPALHDRLLRRFRREAVLGQRMRHPGLVEVRDAGTIDDGDEAHGSAFLVMELLEGWSLFDVLAQCGTLPWPEATELCAQGAEALAALDREGITHRDIKPENLYLLRDGRLKVLDLGVLHFDEELPVSDTNLTDIRTDSNDTVGTVAFMAPEQFVDNGAVDGRSDVYALALVLWEAITGEQPFRGRHWNDVAKRKFTNQPLPPLRTLVPEAPSGLEALLLRCLGLQQHRPRAAEFAAALADLLPAPGVVLRYRLARQVHELIEGLPLEEREISTIERVEPPSLRTEPLPVLAPAAPPAPAPIAHQPPRRWRRRWIAAPLIGVASLLVLSRTRPRLDAAAPAGAPVAERAMTPAADLPAKTMAAPPASTPLPAPTPTRTRRSFSRPEIGRLYVAVHPFADIYIDGQRRTEGSPHSYTLAAGRHAVRAVNADLGMDRSIAVRVPAGGTERLVLDWSKP